MWKKIEVCGHCDDDQLGECGNCDEHCECDDE